MTEDSLVVLSLGFVVLAVVGLVAWFLKLRFRRRELQHQEWMAAVEKGVPLPELGDLETGMDGLRTYLLRGLIWLACGITVTIFLAALWGTTEKSYSTDVWIRQVQQLREIGLSPGRIELAVGSYPIGRQRFPLGLCWIGLVPAGIGVAYLAFYRIEKQRSK
jgi:hypothetical protein